VVLVLPVLVLSVLVLVLSVLVVLLGKLLERTALAPAAFAA
jgi:hypothetical protein